MRNGSNRRRLGARHYLAAMILGTAVTLVSPAQAMAHSVCASPPESGGDGCVGSTHIWVDACDYEADGWGIRTYYYLQSNPGLAAGHVGDANGSASGCGSAPVGTAGNPVVKFDVCAGPNGHNRTCSTTRTA